MNTEISYSGISASPSDHLCPDGHTDIMVNLVPEDGGIRPIIPPKRICQLPTGTQLLLRHSASGGTVNYIFIDRSAPSPAFTLRWLSEADLQADHYDDTRAHELATLSGFRDIVAISNSIVVATDAGLRYFLWRDTTYRQLGPRPPLIPLQFSLGRNNWSEPGWVCGNWSDDFTWQYTSAAVGGPNSLEAKTGNEDTARAITDSVIGRFLQEHKKWTEKGCFFFPFYVRYAFRLFDGSYTWHSAPILMLPNASMPLLRINSNRVDGKTAHVSWSLLYGWKTLLWRNLVSDSVIDALADWKDVIQSIDIFVSPPIYTFDQSKDITEGTVTLDPFDPQSTTTPEDDFTGICNGFVGMSGLTPAANQLYPENYSEEQVLTDPTTVWALTPNPHFLTELQSVADFYLVSSIALDKVKRIPDFEALKFPNPDLTPERLRQRKRLDDDFRSNHDLSPHILWTYNARLNLANIDIVPPTPFPMSLIAQYRSPTPQSTGAQVSVIVWSRINGVVTMAEFTPVGPGLDWSIGAFPEDITTTFPRFVFYPDSGAFLMKVTQGDNTVWLPLKPHDSLSGAYWRAADISLPAKSAASYEPSAEILAQITDCRTSCPHPNRVYLSAPNQPFVFPASHAVAVGSSSIIALSSAARPLSQGQFGSFPLYAFTTEGIWALSVAANGTYSASQPLSRHVALSRHGITQLDQAVAFTADNGIMLLAGSEVSSLTDSILDRYADDLSNPVNDFPNLAAVLRSAIRQEADWVEDCRFTPRSLPSLRMLYDFPSQRLYCYNPGIPGGWVYCFKSAQWGGCFFGSGGRDIILSHINAYPDTMATLRGVNAAAESGDVASFSSNDIIRPATGWMLTRPIKLLGEGVNGDMLKTIDTVIQRGHFTRGHVQTVLYGSRDLKNWFVVWSSRDHYLRGFRGSPYKYFRLALLTSMNRDESISGASISFSPRLTDQLR